MSKYSYIVLGFHTEKIKHTQKRTPRSETIFSNSKYFKTDEKCFLFTINTRSVLNIFKHLS